MNKLIFLVISLAFILPSAQLFARPTLRIVPENPTYKQVEKANEAQKKIAKWDQKRVKAGKVKVHSLK